MTKTSLHVLKPYNTRFLIRLLQYIKLCMTLNAPVLPGSRHGFPLGMLLTPWTAKVPVSSISSTVVPPSCTSRTVPCIHTRDTRRERPLPALIKYPSPLSAAPRIPAALSWPDRTLTGGGRFASLQVRSSTDITGERQQSPEGAAHTGNYHLNSHSAPNVYPGRSRSSMSQEWWFQIKSITSSYTLSLSKNWNAFGLPTKFVTPRWYCLTIRIQYWCLDSLPANWNPLQGG